MACVSTRTGPRSAGGRAGVVLRKGEILAEAARRLRRDSAAMTVG